MISIPRHRHVLNQSAAQHLDKRICIKFYAYGGCESVSKNSDIMRVKCLWEAHKGVGKYTFKKTGRNLHFFCQKSFHFKKGCYICKWI